MIQRIKCFFGYHSADIYKTITYRNINFPPLPVHFIVYLSVYCDKCKNTKNFYVYHIIGACQKKFRDKLTLTELKYILSDPVHRRYKK
jgi:hypothetical protein